MPTPEEIAREMTQNSGSIFAEGSDAPRVPAQEESPEDVSPEMAIAQQMISNVGSGEEAKFNLAVDQGAKENATRSGEILAIADKSGLPYDMVERNLEELKPVVLSKEFDKRRFYNESPEVAKWLAQNPHNYPIAKDDIDKLSFSEKFWGSIFAGAERGALNVELATIGMKRFSGTDTPEDHRRAVEIKGRMGGLGDYRGELPLLLQAPSYLAEQIPLWGSALTGGATAALASGAAGGAAGLLYGSFLPGAGTIGGGSIGFTAGAWTGWRYGSATSMGLIEAGLAFDELIDIKDKQGNYIDKNAVRGMSALVGAANGTLEMIGLGMVTKYVPGLKKLTRSEIKKVLRTATTNKALMTALKTIGTGVGGEGATEGLQEIVNVIAKEIMTKAHTGEFSGMTWQQFVERIAESVKAGALGGGGASVAVSAFNLNRDIQHAVLAKKIEKGFLTFGEVAKTMKVLEKAPNASKKLIKKMAKGESSDVYISGDSWKTYWEKKEMDPEDVAVELLGEDGRRTYNQAVENGGDMAIPIEEYSAKIAPTEHNSHFAKELRATPGQKMNGREADELFSEMDRVEKEATGKKTINKSGLIDYLKKSGQTQYIKEDGTLDASQILDKEGNVQEAFAQVVSAEDAPSVFEQEKPPAPTDTIEDNLTKQLVERVGVSEEDARSQALLNAEFFRAMGTRSDKEIQSLFDKHDLQIHAPDYRKAWNDFLKGEGVDEFYEIQDGTSGTFEDRGTGGKKLFQEREGDIEHSLEYVNDKESKKIKGYDFRKDGNNPLLKKYLKEIKKKKRNWDSEDIQWVESLLKGQDQKALRGLKEIPRNEKLHKDYEFKFNLGLFESVNPLLFWEANVVDKKTGKIVGGAYGLFGNHSFYPRKSRRIVPGISVKGLEVSEKHQRKGIAREMYRTIVEKSGRPVIDVGRMRSEEGAAFRDAIRDNKVFYQEQDQGKARKVEKNEALHKKYDFEISERNVSTETEEGVFSVVVQVKDKVDNSNVGWARLVYDKENGLLFPNDFGGRVAYSVDINHQRQGIGKEMLRVASEKYDQPIANYTGGPGRTQAGEDFRNAIRDDETFYQQVEDFRLEENTELRREYDFKVSGIKSQIKAIKKTKEKAKTKLVPQDVELIEDLDEKIRIANKLEYEGLQDYLRRLLRDRIRADYDEYFDPPFDVDKANAIERKYGNKISIEIRPDKEWKDSYGNNLPVYDVYYDDDQLGEFKVADINTTFSDKDGRGDMSASTSDKEKMIRERLEDRGLPDGSPFSVKAIDRKTGKTAGSLQLRVRGDGQVLIPDHTDRSAAVFAEKGMGIGSELYVTAVNALNLPITSTGLVTDEGLFLRRSLHRRSPEMFFQAVESGKGFKGQGTRPVGVQKRIPKTGAKILTESELDKKISPFRDFVKNKLDEGNKSKQYNVPFKEDVFILALLAQGKDFYTKKEGATKRNLMESYDSWMYQLYRERFGVYTPRKFKGQSDKDYIDSALYSYASDVFIHGIDIGRYAKGNLKSASGKANAIAKIGKELLAIERAGKLQPRKGVLDKIEKHMKGSYAVDDSGQPLLLYRGRADNQSKVEGPERTTFFSTSRISAASYTDYSGKVINAYVSIKNPLTLSAKGKNWNKISGGLSVYGKDGEKVGSINSLIKKVEKKRGKSFERQFQDVGSKSFSTNDITKMAKLLGHDGVIIKNVSDVGPFELSRVIAGKKTSTSVIVFNNSQILEIPRKELFQPKDPKSSKDPRGMITVGADKKMRIDLFKEKNLSTFLHESGHMYLEVLGDLAEDKNAPPEVKADYQKVLNWLGVASRGDIQRHHHEKWAVGFESFLREGKAPSVELRKAFQKFRDWLVNIYGEVQKLFVTLPDGTKEPVEISDEIRGVMGRMLATKEQIERAQAEEGQLPMFEDMKSAGMTGEQARSYSGAIVAAQEAAIEELTQKHIRQVEREKKRFWKDDSEKVREEILPEIHGDKVYIALNNMQRGKLPNGEPLPKGISQIKLNKEALQHDFGPEFLKTLPRPHVYAREGGLHHDMAAELFGFKSGKQMLDELVKAEPMKKLIKDRVNQIMKERHGDMMVDKEAARTEAINSIHNDKLSLLMRKELNYLASDHFAKFKGLAKRIARPIPTIKDVRENAKTIISQMKVRDIHPGAYSRAMARAAKDASEKFFKGDFLGAFEAKRKQLLNNELYREAVRAKERVEKIVDFMKRFETTATRQRIGKAGGTYLEQIDAIMDRYSFRKGISLKALDKQQSLLAWMQEQQEMGNTVEIPEKLLNEARKQHYKDTAFSELEEIKETVQTIAHLAKTKNELLADKESRDMQAAEDEIVASIEAHHTIKREPVDYAPGKWARLVKSAKGFFGAHVKMEFLFKELDGFKAQGAVWNYLFRPFVDAENVEADMAEANNKRMKEIFEPYTKQGAKDIFTKKIFIKEVNAALTKANILMVALNQGNAYNKEALVNGEGWSQSQVDAILSHMTKQDWDATQAIWDHVNSYWPQVAQQEKDLNGIVPQKVESLEVETPFGKYAGGYFPIIFDTDRSFIQERRAEAVAVQEMFGGNFAKAITKHGHTKERSNTGGKPLSLNLLGLSHHISSVIHDLAFRKPVIDVSKIIHRPAVRGAIEGAVGRELYRQINPWLGAVAADRRTEPTPSHEAWLFSTFRNNVTVVSMGLKMTTAVVQFSGYTQVLDEVGWRWGKEGLKAMKNPIETLDFITSRSTFMKNRPKEFDRDVKDSIRKGESFTQQQIPWFYFISQMDMLVSAAGWMSAYKKAMDGGMENIDAGDEKGAILYADEVVRTTQGGGAVKDLAAIQRGTELFKNFSMFYSFFSVQFNRFRQAIKRFISDRDFHKFFTSYMWIVFIPGILDDIILGRGPDEDEDWSTWLIKKQLQAPVQGVIGFRDLFGGLLDKYGYSASPTQAVGESISRSGKTVTDVLITGEKGIQDLEEKDYKQLFITAGYLGGIPSRQIWITSNYFYEWQVTGEQQPDNPAELLWRGLVTGAPKDE